MKILNKKPLQLLDEFLIDYSQLFSIDINEAKAMIKNNFNFYDGKSSLSVSSEMEDNWYKSLENNLPDYSVYDNDNYFIDLWCCWKMYSREYVKILAAKGTLVKYFINHSIVDLLVNSSNTVIDLGCGIGYSTASLKDIFPMCTVYGFNIAGSKQFKFCQFISKKYDINIIGEYESIGNVDIVFASEYFEHFERPIEHLEDVVSRLNPKHIIIANSFNTKSIGHFIDYKNHNEVINQKDISRRFNKAVLNLGYSKLKTKIFNSKPNIYSINKA